MWQAGYPTKTGYLTYLGSPTFMQTGPKLNNFCLLVQEGGHVFYVFKVKGTGFQTLPKCGIGVFKGLFIVESVLSLPS